MGKKVLIVGELNEIVRSLNECLADDFKTQLCSEQLENVQAMVKIFKPDIILLCRIGVEETDRAVFTWVRGNCPQIPLLIVTTHEKWDPDSGFEENEKLAVLFRPVAKSELLEKCYRLLSMGIASWPKEAGEENTQRRRKIMLVDDSALLLRNMKSMLGGDYDICLAKSGEQALKLIPEERPDLILLDYEMEGMDGRCTFEAMKEDEEMRDIPVVFLTSIANRSAIYSVLKSRPDGYILKPPDEKRIRETIEDILSSD